MKWLNIFGAKTLTYCGNMASARLKLQRQVAGKYSTKGGPKHTYHKFLILVPKEIVTSLGWPEGADLDFVKAGEVLVVFRTPAAPPVASAPLAPDQESQTSSET